MNDKDYLRGMGDMLRLSEDDFRNRIQEVSPEIRHDISVMTDLMRELVKIERVKAGVDDHHGRLVLTRNTAKTDARQPDLIGSGQVAGHYYKVMAWAKGDSLEIVLEPKKRE